jgi:hypothetical protein
MNLRTLPMTAFAASRRLLKRILTRTGTLGLVSSTAAFAERLDPALVIATRRLPPAPPLALVAVYRLRHETTLMRLIATLPPGTRIALWGLDGLSPALAAQTVGVGPAERFSLLNRCVAALGPEAEDEWLAVSDDDVALRRGDLSDAARIARAAGLDLSQPAHCWSSNMSWRYNRRRLFVVARSGQFVEIGPLLLLSPRARSLALPFPEAKGMGWGTEAEWASLQDRGLRLGVLDAILMDHLEPMGTNYDVEAERTRESEVLASHGLDDLRALQTDHACWYAWQRPRVLAR